MVKDHSHGNHAGSQGPLDLQAQIVRAERNELGKMGGLQPRQYRRKALARRGLNWSVMDPSLYSEAFTGRARTIPRCQYYMPAGRQHSHVMPTSGFTIDEITHSFPISNKSEVARTAPPLRVMSSVSHLPWVNLQTGTYVHLYILVAMVIQSCPQSAATWPRY